MAFDGRPHGVGNLISPFPHLPHAPGLADGLSMALRYTYAASRKARSIGVQPYAPAFRSTLGQRILPGEWVGVARFMAIQRPEWVSHAVAELRYHLDPSEQATLRYRLTATDGGATDSVVLTEEISPPGEDEPQRPRRRGAPVLLPLSTVGAGALDVTLEVYVSSPAAATFNGFELRAENTAAWWVTLG